MNKGKLARWLHLGHRWLGIVLGLMVLLWFISGIVMLYVARPQLDEAERLAGLPILDGASVIVSPAAAWQALGLLGEPEAIRLNASDGRLAYRILANNQWHMVNAENAKILSPTNSVSASRLVQGYFELNNLTAISSVGIDQWTVYRQFDPYRPFWRIELDDGRDFYISTRSGELVLDTSASERAWNWIGSVVHWIYFTQLRQQTHLWRPVVQWCSFLGLLLAVTGIWIGCQRLRIREFLGGGRISPYREPWKRLHHLMGIAGALVLAVWLFSGWLSMAPFGLASAPDRVVNTTPLSVAKLHALPKTTPFSREIEWIRLGNQLFILDKRTDGTYITPEGQEAKSTLSLVEIDNAVRSVPGLTIARISWLEQADTRYYPLRHRPVSFPVAIIELADDKSTSLYISPRNGQILESSNRYDFVHRWLYLGLHRQDFPFFVDRPWLREALIVLLSLFGIAFCITGCRLAWLRVFRKVPRSVDHSSFTRNSS